MKKYIIKYADGRECGELKSSYRIEEKWRTKL